jgi:hypothetical protein
MFILRSQKPLHAHYISPKSRVQSSGNNRQNKTAKSLLTRSLKFIKSKARKSKSAILGQILTVEEEQSKIVIRSMCKNRSKKGSALIISMLLLAVISTASFAIARLALIELKSGDLAVGNVKAYYLAEGGIEEGLLRWRYNHSADLIPTTTSALGSTESTKAWERTQITDSSLTRATATDSNFNSGADSSKDYMGLTVYDQVKTAVGGSLSEDDLYRDFKATTDPDPDPISDYIAKRPDLYVGKDNKLSFLIPKGGASDLSLVWQFHRIANWNSSTGQSDSIATATWQTMNSLSKFGVDVRLYKVNSSGADSLLKEKIFSPSGHEIVNSDTTACDSTSPACSTGVPGIKAEFNETGISDDILVTLTPINANIVVGAFGTGPVTSSQTFVDSVTHIESVGTSGGRTRGLETAIDRASGQILGLYDFVLYQGS